MPLNTNARCLICQPFKNIIMHFACASNRIQRWERCGFIKYMQNKISDFNVNLILVNSVMSFLKTIVSLVKICKGNE